MVSDSELRAAEIVRDYNTFLNEQVTKGGFAVETLLELTAQTYLRYRIYRTRDVAVQSIEEVVRTVEHALNEGSLNLELEDGTVLPFRTAEEYAERGDLLDMLREASESARQHGEAISEAELTAFLRQETQRSEESKRNDTKASGKGDG